MSKTMNVAGIFILGAAALCGGGIKIADISGYYAGQKRVEGTAPSSDPNSPRHKICNEMRAERNDAATSMNAYRRIYTRAAYYGGCG